MTAPDGLAADGPDANVCADVGGIGAPLAAACVLNAAGAGGKVGWLRGGWEKYSVEKEDEEGIMGGVLGLEEECWA